MEDKQAEQWRKDPKNWKYGLFYYNPEDKRIFPRKRIREMGWTVNFTQKWSVFVFVLIMVLAFLAVLYLPIKC